MRKLFLFIILTYLLSGCDIVSQVATNSVQVPTGSIMFNNASTNPYHVLLDGSLIFSNGMAGKSTFTKSNLKIGYHTVKVIQIKGYLFKPTEKVYTVKVLQGKVTTLTFP